VCRALAYAHQRGVLHGNVKPSNVFANASGTQAKLGDFGLARWAERVQPEALLTRIAGTPAYMAPEQRKVGSMMTVATDVYLLAATLWALILGDPPGPSPKAPKGDPQRR
jgi:serine/threonine-protein kinase